MEVDGPPPPSPRAFIHQHGHHLGFYEELEIRVKPPELFFFVLDNKKITHKQALCLTLAARLTISVEKKLKKHVFSLKNGLTTCYF